LPTAAIVVPLFITLRSLGLVNTYLGLILVYTILTLPLSVWMLTSYFRAIPVELEEAAIVDGASRLSVLWRITLPLSLPGVVSIVIYAFVTTWNEFIFALVFAQDSRVKTLPIGIAEIAVGAPTARRAGDQRSEAGDLRKSRRVAPLPRSISSTASGPTFTTR
jgi:ABC-type glycerol-3-phosphate transport system permease component